MIIMTKGKILKDIIEEVLFNKSELDQLKQLINDLYDGRLTPKELRVYIFDQKNKNMDKLVELFPYLIKQLKMNDSKPQITDNSLDMEKQAELLEKNKFIEHIGTRVNTIFNKLKKRMKA